MFKKTVLMGITVVVLCALTQNSAFAGRRAYYYNYPATSYYYPATSYYHPATGYYYPTTGVYHTAAVSGSSSAAGFSFWPFLLNTGITILESELGNSNLGGNLDLKTLIQSILTELLSQQTNTNSSLLTAKKAPSEKTDAYIQIKNTETKVDNVLIKLGIPANQIPTYPKLATP
jgi:hypothetical protein